MSDEFNLEGAWGPYKDFLPFESVTAVAQTVSIYLGQPIIAVVPSITSTDNVVKLDQLFFATADLWAQVKPDGSDIIIVRRRAYWIGWNFRPNEQPPWVAVRIDHAQQAFSIVQFTGKDSEAWCNQLRALFPADVVMG